jgi:hypothetical protein
MPSRSVDRELRDCLTHGTDNCRPPTTIDQIWRLPAWTGRDQGVGATAGSGGRSGGAVEAANRDDGARAVIGADDLEPR